MEKVLAPAQLAVALHDLLVEDVVGRMPAAGSTRSSRGEQLELAPLEVVQTTTRSRYASDCGCDR